MGEHDERDRDLAGFSSGRPITAASVTSECVSSSPSSSAGGTWNPLYLMNSLIRSVMKKYPSTSTQPRSPVWSQPSPSTVDAVAAGLLRYPAITCGPRTHSSPWTSWPTASPVAGSTINASVFGARTPTEPGLMRTPFWDQASTPGVACEAGESYDCVTFSDDLVGHDRELVADFPKAREHTFQHGLRADVGARQQVAIGLCPLDGLIHRSQGSRYVALRKAGVGAFDDFLVCGHDGPLSCEPDRSSAPCAHHRTGRCGPDVRGGRGPEPTASPRLDSGSTGAARGRCRARC